MESSIGNVLQLVRRQFHVEDFRDAYTGDCCGDSSAMSEMFHRHFLQSEREDRDDLLFYVKTDAREKDGVVDVVRRDSQTLPKLSDMTVLWDQTLYLNILMHEFEYEVCCGVLAVPEPGEKPSIRITNRVSCKVYPSPSEHRMDKKGKKSDAIFPDIIFSVDNFEEIFAGLELKNPGEKVAVQIVATNAAQSIRKLVFIGGLEYTVIKNACLAKQKDKHPSRIKRLSMRKKHGYSDFKQQLQFVRMRGPHMKGFAEMGFDLIATDTDEGGWGRQDSNGDCSDLESSGVVHKLDSPVLERAVATIKADVRQEAASSPIDLPSEFTTNGHSASQEEQPNINPFYNGFTDSSTPADREPSEPMQSSVNLVPASSRVVKSALLLRLQATQERNDSPLPPATTVETGSHDPLPPLSKDVDWEREPQYDHHMEGSGESHESRPQYEAFKCTHEKLKRENSVKRLVKRLSFKSGKSTKNKQNSYVISSYLTFIRLPWYLVLDDILNGSRLPLL